MHSNRRTTIKLNLDLPGRNVRAGGSLRRSPPLRGYFLSRLSFCCRSQIRKSYFSSQQASSSAFDRRTMCPWNCKTLQRCLGLKRHCHCAGAASISKRHHYRCACAASIAKRYHCRCACAAFTSSVNYWHRLLVLFGCPSSFREYYELLAMLTYFNF